MQSQTASPITTVALAASMLAACAGEPEAPALTIGSVTAEQAVFTELVDPDARPEVLAQGFGWAEGPLWTGDAGLIFSDVPANTVYSWTGGDSVSVWLSPSGYTGEVERGGESGSNGLTLDPMGQLVLAQHGDRRIARMTAPLNGPAAEFETIVATYDDRRFNSPNDLVYGPDGTLYFTDPTYGLDAPASAELGFSGVFRVSPAGELSLVDSLSYPNGVGVSPDGSVLYVANSDPERAVWMAYDILEDGTVTGGRVFHDATNLVGRDNPGLPDGLKVDTQGRIWATGPGGVWVFLPDGTHLGTIRTDVQTANVAFGPDGVLYLTSSMYLARIPTSVRGL